MVQGLPDGYIFIQKSRFGYILEGLGMEQIGILYGHFGIFYGPCYIVWSFGVYFHVMVYFTKKNLATL
jgi:hypothetical protein